MPLFSVIIPVYNRAKLVRRTLASVFEQTFTDFETIVVDDGSTDRSVAVLQRYEDRIRLFCEPNRGCGAARNVGLRHARGRYIAFLDSDDLWFPWTLATFARAIERHGEPSFITGDGLDFFNEDGPPTVEEGPYREELFADYLASRGTGYRVSPGAAVVRADALRETGGFLEGRRINAEDADMWLKLGAQPGYVRIHEPKVFGYRRHAVSLVADRSATQQGMLYLIDRELADGYSGGAERAADRRTIITCHVRPVTLEHLRVGQQRWAWQLYLRTFGWQLRQRRYKYLLGFPFRSLSSVVRPAPRPPAPPLEAADPVPEQTA